MFRCIHAWQSLPNQLEMRSRATEYIHEVWSLYVQRRVRTVRTEYRAYPRTCIHMEYSLVFKVDGPIFSFLASASASCFEWVACEGLELKTGTHDADAETTEA